jgi:membrane protein implicated in regulation of membrane protease activity
MLQRMTWDEVGIVVALAIAGVLFLTGGSVLLGALLCVAAVAAAIALWTPVRERLHIPPSPRRGLFR